MDDGRGIDRRDLLVGGMSVLGGLGLLPGVACALPQRASAAGGRGLARGAGTLVLIQLTGGNDGLSMVVPHGDDRYHRARSATRVEPAKVLDLDGYRGLHPGLVGLRRVFNDGRLAVIEGCGYPDPNRSHFKSFEIWHTARHRGRASGPGWVGRLCDAAFGTDYDARRVVHVGGALPYSLHSPSHPASCFVVPEGYRWIENEGDVEGYGERKAAKGPGGQTNPSLAYLRSVLDDARASSAAIRSAATRYRPSVTYPEDGLAYDLQTAAALIHAGIGTRIVSVELRGFDTHAGQRVAHDRLMARLDGALSAFLADLEASEVGRSTLVLAFSEFGRRVVENASRGTDHGTAGPMLVAGHHVRGGLHGRHPSLEDLDDGDLVHTTDFRSVYAELIETCFDVDNAAVLGARYPILGVVRSS